MSQKITDSQKTKIVATIGPASESIEKLRQLVIAGVNIFRINFSHGTHEQHARVIENIQEVNKELKTHVGILADLQGPKIRVGKIENGGIPLAKGSKIKFVQTECLGNRDRVYIQYKKFAEDVHPGDRILCDDGKIILEVSNVSDDGEVELEVVFGGLLQSFKGVNLPDTKISMPSLTAKDRKDLDFILKFPINWIALSFVRNAAEIKELSDIISKANHNAKVIAKVEKPEAIENIKEIIKASNGIMIARGDLGVEVPMETVPSIQKNIIKRCIQRARPVIVATQLMESMIKNPSPTRAEITDVANAVLDGTDAVMLSGETSVGDYPVKVVETMNRIISEAEKNYSIALKRPKADSKATTYLSDVVCIQGAKTSEEVKAKAITGVTVSGYAAFKISSFRPPALICVFSASRDMLRTLNLVWGVRGFYYDKFTTTDETIEDIVAILKDHKIIEIGDTIVNTGSMPIQKRSRTNFLKITIVD